MRNGLQFGPEYAIMRIAVSSASYYSKGEFKMKRLSKTAAAAVSAVLAMQSLPLVGTIHAADAGKEILVTGFEDDGASKFTKRGDDDTSVIEKSTEKPHSGDACMSVTGRSEGWNGPALVLSDLGCEPGIRYIASAWVKTQWYNECKLSLQYTDADGEQHYSNLSKAVSQGEWVKIPDTKFSFSADMKDVQIYIESNDKVDLYVDDFSLTEGPSYSIQKDIPSLKDVYNGYFKVGTAVTAAELAPNATKDLIRKHFNSLTLGNELKPENMLDQKACQKYLKENDDNTVPQVGLQGSAKIILDFAKENNIPVRGHTLVWHSQTPTWFFKDDYTMDGDWVSKDVMLKRMENYIKGVFEVIEAEYSDIDFYAWDVVNEAFDDNTAGPRNPGVYEDYRGDSAWVKVFGDNSFIKYAFKYARQYAPAETKLYYNDYNEYMTEKQNSIIKLVRELAADNLIDGIGMQSHLDVRKGSDAFPSAQHYAMGMKNFVDVAKELNLDLQVTELDATLDKSCLNEAGFETQAKYYSDIMDVIVKYKDYISAVVFWGTTDDQSWRVEGLPLLFNEDYTAKPCFDSIIDGIEYVEPPVTTPKVTTTKAATTTTEAVTTKEAETTSCILTTGYGVIRYGDTDCNNMIDVSDAVLLARVITEDRNAVITDSGRKNADCDRNGTLDPDDITMILRHIAKLEILPVAE